MEFVKEYGYMIWWAVMLIFYAIFEWQNLEKKVHEAILNAKRMAKDGILKSGQAQEDFAVDHFYPLLPTRLRMFVTKEQFRKLVKWIYKQAISMLEVDDEKI